MFLRARKRAFVLSMLFWLAILLYAVTNTHRHRSHQAKAWFDTTIDKVLDDILGVSSREFPLATKYPYSDTKDICRRISGKKLLLVGPETTFHLHDLWLNALEDTDGHHTYCPGANYCAFHHICHSADGNRTISASYQGRKLKHPSIDELRDTGTAVLRYTLSSTLAAIKDKDDPIYSQPSVDPSTNIRTHNHYWLQKAKNADIIVISRSPIPAPAWTYSQHSSDGSIWAPVYWNKPTAARQFFQIALDTVLQHFLPSLLLTLDFLASSNESGGKIIIWQGNWPLNPSCTNTGLPPAIPRIRQFWSPRIEAVDPWTFYYNAQGTYHSLHPFGSHSFRAVYLQNKILPRLLHQYNITFLRMEPRTRNRPYRMEDNTHKDCIRRGGQDIAEEFFSGLGHMLDSMM